jgi:two-component system cell cycle response regulator
MVLPETSGENAVAACERLRKTVADHQFSYDGRAIPVTVSIGVAVNGPDADTPERLLRAADTRLYQAKADGRNRVAY